MSTAEFTTLNATLGELPARQIQTNTTMEMFAPPACNLNSFPASTITTSGATVFVQVEVPSPTTYFFRGFFPSSGQYEYWRGTSRNTPPPTGHSLLDITVIGEIRG